MAAFKGTLILKKNSCLLSWCQGGFVIGRQLVVFNHNKTKSILVPSRKIVRSKEKCDCRRFCAGVVGGPVSRACTCLC